MDKTKNIMDASAIVTGGLSLAWEHMPQIAAFLSAVWLVLRIGEWVWSKVKKERVSSDD